MSKVNHTIQIKSYVIHLCINGMKIGSLNSGFFRYEDTEHSTQCTSGLDQWKTPYSITMTYMLMQIYAQQTQHKQTHAYNEPQKQLENCDKQVSFQCDFTFIVFSSAFHMCNIFCFLPFSVCCPRPYVHSNVCTYHP